MGAKPPIEQKIGQITRGQNLAYLGAMAMRVESVDDAVAFASDKKGTQAQIRPRLGIEIVYPREPAGNSSFIIIIFDNCIYIYIY